MSEYAFIRFVTDFTGEFVNVGAIASSGEIHAAMIVKDLTRALAFNDLERCDESWMRAFLEPIAAQFRELSVIEAHLASFGRELRGVSDTEPDPICLVSVDESDHFS
jgi:hypothetical protein